MQSSKERLRHGGGVSLKFSGNFYNGYFDSNNTVFNTLEFKWRYKESDNGAEWSNWTNLVLNSDFEYGSENKFTSKGYINLGNNYDYKKSYIFELEYKDKLTLLTFQQFVNVGEPCIDYGKDKDGENYFWVNGNIYMGKMKNYTGSCNNIKETCLLWINNGSDCPAQLNNINFGFLFTKYTSDNYIEQEFADANSNQRFTRSKIGGVWYPWTKILTQTDLDSINGEIASITVPALAVCTDITEHVLTNFTIAKAGRYMFLADVPLNYYRSNGQKPVFKTKSKHS
jgi:hypothetical protein